MFAWTDDTVTRIRAGVKVVRGTPVPDWENATTKDIDNCSMQPASTSLSEDGRVLGIADGYTLYAPYDADIIAGDRIGYEGNTYTITGEPRRWKSPAGRMAHLVVNLMRWQG
jgi:hypothetical protein